MDPCDHHAAECDQQLFVDLTTPGHFHSHHQVFVVNNKLMTITCLSHLAMVDKTQKISFSSPQFRTKLKREVTLLLEISNLHKTQRMIG